MPDSPDWYEVTQGNELLQGDLLSPSLKTIVHALWDRLESQSVTRWLFDACI